MIEKDEDLIIAFVVREAKDYIPPKDNDWIVKVVHQIKQKVPDNLGTLILTCIGNSGVTVRELKIYGAGKNKCHLLVDPDGEGTVAKIS